MLAVTTSEYLWTTPENAPTEYICRRFYLPADTDWLGLINGALTMLTNEDYFRVPDGHVSAETVSCEVLKMLFDSLAGCPDGGVSMPIGSIVAWPSMTIPDNMLLCNGSMHYRADYPDLYDTLDSQWYVDATRFYVPNLVERFVYGAVHSTDLGSTGGSETHTLTIDEMPSHTHGIAATITTDDGSAKRTVAHADNVQSMPTGGDQPHNNMPPYIKMAWVIVALD